MVTHNAAKGMRMERYGVQVGDWADLVLLDSTGVRDALRRQPDRLAVIKRGRLVAETKAERVTHF